MIDIFHGHQYEIRQIALSPDGRQLSSVSGDEIFIWDLATGTRISSFLSPEGPLFNLWSVAYSSDGKQLVTGCGLKDVGSVRLWDIGWSKQSA